METLGKYLSKKFGVGRKMLDKICCKFGVYRWILLSEIEKQDLLLINKFIEKMCLNKEEHELFLNKLVEKEFKINSLKGFCYRNGLPVHGQRTKTNGRTAKNKKMLSYLKTK